MQKDQALTQSKLQLEQAKSQMDSQKMQQEVMHKKELMITHTSLVEVSVKELLLL